MAFVPPAIPAEQENQFAPTGVTTPNPLALLPPQATSTGGSAGTGTTGGFGVSPTTGTPTQFGSNASKLSDYLTANADQVQKMGDTIAGNMNTQFGNVQGDVGKLGADFGTAVNAGYTPQDPSVLASFNANPTAFAADPNNVKAFQSEMNSSYTGPQNVESFAPYSNVQNEVQSAVQNSQLLNAPAGLSTYLQNNAKGTYTPGMNTLDTVLLSGSQPAYKTVQDSVAQFNSLPDYLTGMVSKGNASVPAAQKAAADTSAAAKAAYSGVANPFVEGLNKSYSDASQKSLTYNNELNDISAKIAAGKFEDLTPEEQQLASYNPSITRTIEDYPTIFPTQAQNNPINFSTFFNGGPQAPTPTPADVVSPDQIAEYQALSTLAGNAPSGLNFDMPTSPSFRSLNPAAPPQYNDAGALTAINNSYGPFYQTGQQGGVPFTQSQNDYMSLLATLLGQPQPSPSGQGGLGPPNRGSGPPGRGFV